MDAQIWLSLAVLTLAYCHPVTSASLGNDGYQHNTADHKLQLLQNIERYLKEIKEILTAERDQSLVEAINAEMPALLPPSDKRFSSSELYGDEDVPSDLNTNNFLRALDYRDGVHNRRWIDDDESQVSKRQPPAGFHAVRGKRSAKATEFDMNQ